MMFWEVLAVAVTSALGVVLYFVALVAGYVREYLSGK